MRERVLLGHEAAFNLFLASAAARHFAAGGPASWPAWAYLGIVLGSALTLAPDLARPSPWAHRARLLWYPLAMSLAFNLMRGTVGAIAGPPADGGLLAADVALFGATPSVWFQAVEAPWLGEVLSLAYMLFFAYLYGSCLRRAARLGPPSDGFFAGLFALYAVGFLGYTLVPALGPYLAEAALYRGPIANGPVAAWALRAVLAGTNGADAFPSLHVGVTLFILLFDWRHDRVAFRLAVAPAALLCAATLYLRFHYGVDVLAGAALAFAMQAACGLRVPLPFGRLRAAAA